MFCDTDSVFGIIDQFHREKKNSRINSFASDTFYFDSFIFKHNSNHSTQSFFL